MWTLACTSTDEKNPTLEVKITYYVIRIFFFFFRTREGFRRSIKGRLCLKAQHNQLTHAATQTCGTNTYNEAACGEMPPWSRGQSCMEAQRPSEPSGLEGLEKLPHRADV